jgi:hypothetical protein
LTHFSQWRECDRPTFSPPRWQLPSVPACQSVSPKLGLFCPFMGRSFVFSITWWLCFATFFGPVVSEPLLSLFFSSEGRKRSRLSVWLTASRWRALRARSRALQTALVGEIQLAQSQASIHRRLSTPSKAGAVPLPPGRTQDGRTGPKLLVYSRVLLCQVVYSGLSSLVPFAYASLLRPAPAWHCPGLASVPARGIWSQTHPSKSRPRTSFLIPPHYPRDASEPQVAWELAEAR